MKTMILDVAGVLVDFPWKNRFLELGIPKEDVDFLAEATLKSDAWAHFDAGTWEDEKVLSEMKKNAPGKEEFVQRIWDKVSEAVATRPYAKEWIRHLKKCGYGVYILSNYPGKIYEECKDRLTFETEADGVIWSYRVKLAKPDKKIYELLLNRFQLEAKECVFIDDTPINLVEPKKLGITTIHFETFHQVQEELEKLGVPKM